MSAVVIMWSFAVFLASVFAACIANSILTPKYHKKKLILWWLGIGILGFLLTLISYQIDLYNDLIGILGLSALLCLSLIPAYKGSVGQKLFVGMMAALIANVVTFMFCGTTDTFIGKWLGFFEEGTPYNVKNLFLFIGIKVVVYTFFFVIHWKFLRKRVQDMLLAAEDQIKNYLVAPAVSIVGFYVINLVTNNTGIMPTNRWFFPLYLTICLIFIFAYIQIFTSVNWTAEAMKNEKEKERIGAELNVATQIQADMLPRIFPAFPERKEFDIYASMTPAKEVGGDFYDFFLIDEDHLALVMADVSGKGVPAALFMVIAKTLIKNRAQLGGSPAKILQDVNERLCEGNEAELFVTVWLAILEISTGKGIAANAGHEHPALKRAGGSFEMVKYRHSPAVATMEGIRFREHTFELHPGDSLYVYTDGVTEATNKNNELFGEERTLLALNKNLSSDAKETLITVKNEIDAFVGDAVQFDDITMLCINYFGSGEGVNCMKTKKICVEAKDENLHSVLEFARNFLEEQGCSSKIRMLIEVCMEEWFINIAHYAYPHQSGQVEIEIKLDEGTAEIVFTDSGIPFNPLEKKDPDVTLAAEQRDIGGLGIYMVKKKMDEVSYRYENKKNIFMFRKKIK